MKKRKQAVLCIIIMLTAAALYYTRPMTVNELYAAYGFDLTACVSISGSYWAEENGRYSEDILFQFSRAEQQAEALVELFSTQEFRRSLKNFLPRGTKIHRTQEGDFRWDISLIFDRTEFPDGSAGSGQLLRFHNFFGTLELTFSHSGETLCCTTKNQDAFLQEVFSLISSES